MLILALDITVPGSSILQDIVQELEDEYGFIKDTDYHIIMDTSIKSRNKKAIVKFVLSNPSGLDTFEIYGVQDQSGNFVFGNLRLQECNKFCYKTTDVGGILIPDSITDMTEGMIRTMLRYSTIPTDYMVLDIGGNVVKYLQDGHTQSLMLCGLDKQTGMLYSFGGATTQHEESLTEEEEEQNISFNRPIKEYLKEMPIEAKQQFKAASTMGERMDIVGKWAIEQKADGEFTAKEFQDVFLQAGAIGFSNPLCKTIYNLYI